MDPLFDKYKNTTTYLIIDSDNLFFNYKSGFINILGTVANALENNLVSAWNYDANLLAHNINHGSNSIESFSLRRTINTLVQSESIHSQHINDSLSILTVILNKEQTMNNTRLNSLCNAFDYSTLYSISIENDKFVKRRVKTLDDFKVTHLINFINDLVLLGFYNNNALISASSPGHFDQFFSSPCTAFNNTHLLLCHVLPLNVIASYKFIFITSLPSVLAEFLSIQEFLPTMSNNCTIISHIDDLSHTELVTISKSFKILSNNQSFIDKLTDGLLKACPNMPKVEKSVISKPNNSGKKVDLFSTLATNGNRTIGSYLELRNKITLVGTVFPGHGRGLPLLGIPTANLRCEDVPHLITGVYIGYAYIEGNAEVSRDEKLDAIVSIGFNPHFFGENYSIETYLYHEFNDTLLDQRVHLHIEGYLRTDSKFDSLESLIQAIQQDLHLHKAILASSE